MTNVLETFLENRADFQYVNKDIPDLIIADSSKQLHSIERFLPEPRTIEYNREFTDLRGFIDYVNDFKTDNTVCFAGAKQIEVIFNAHQKDKPSWQKHSVTYKINQSHRWQIWTQAHNQWKNQKNFAEFLDTGLNEIVSPKQSDILSLVKNFRATVSYEVDYQEVPGGTNFAYSKTVKGMAKKENIEIPEYIEIALQPFDNLTVINSRLKPELKIPAYTLRAKINFRVEKNPSDEQTVEFKIQILNFEDAVNETLESIRAVMGELTQVKTYIA